MDTVPYGPGEIYASQEEAQAAAEKNATASEQKRKDDLVRLAHERFDDAEEAETQIRLRADEDTRFRAGEQWDQTALRQRKDDKRPALVINRIPQFERQITNEQRQSKPAIQVSPIDSGADKETAEILQGLIRHIEYDSNAEVAYDTALTSAVRGGLGYIRIVSEFEFEGSFDQALKIKRARDWAAVYMDPGAREQDCSDAEWAFVVEDAISQEHFKREYPDAEPVEGGWGSRTNARGHTCQVVEYFYRDRTKDELVQLQAMTMDPQSGQPMPDGDPFIIYHSDAPLYGDRLANTVVVKTRPTERILVKWCKIAGSTVIEETEFPAPWIPIVPVLGDELWVDGRRILEGVVRHARDSQRMYNYWASATTETIALAPKAPWIVAEGQLAGYENKWTEAATRNVPFLEYRLKTLAGQPAPPPMRNAFEAPIQAMAQLMQFAAEDMKATTGIYDAALGNRSNETSGIAIQGRQQQSQLATMHFSDNLARALRHVGRILIAAIPRVYSEARVLRILGEDGSQKMVGVNGAPAQQGQDRTFDLNTGRYDVAVSMGPAYNTKREQAVSTMMEFIRAYPGAAPLVGDVLAKNMDWPGSQKIADRLRKMLPPQVAEQDPDQKFDPQVLAQKVQELSQQNAQLTQAVHQAHDTMDAKTLELQSQERKDLLARHTDLAKAFAMSAPEDEMGRTVLLQEMSAISERLRSYFPPAPATTPTNQPQPGSMQ